MADDTQAREDWEALCPYERLVLDDKMLHGWGAAVGAALDALKNMGLVDGYWQRNDRGERCAAYGRSLPEPAGANRRQ